MDEARKVIMPEIELADDDPLLPGVILAAKVFSTMLSEKIWEYGSLNEQSKKALETFELYYETYFGRDLRFSLLIEKDWEEKMKDPIFKEKVAALEAKHGKGR